MREAEAPSEPALSEPALRALEAIVGAERVLIDLEARERASRDFGWLSPILTERLPSTPADLVVRPSTSDEVAAVLRVAATHAIPVTPRGKGTGNYGQAVPLRAGLVLDLADCTAIRSITGAFDGGGAEGDAVADVEAGVTFTQLERAAAEVGAEVPVMPSTVSSSVGGFLSGGNQGIGSIEHGSIWDGWVLGLDVVGCREDAEPFAVGQEDLAGHLHTYGTGGILLGARLRLAPKRVRTVLFASFSSFADAAGAGLGLMRLEPPPRVLSLDDPELVPTLPAHDAVVPGSVMLRAEIEVSTTTDAVRMVTDAGGSVTGLDDDAASSLYASVYNHATVRARRTEPDLCSIQVRGPALIERGDEVRSVLPGARLHLDGNAPRKHGVGYSGLLLSTFVDADTLYAGMQRLRDLGVLVIDPHSWVLGGHGGLDRIRAVADRVDPHGLLNPGKLPV